MKTKIDCPNCGEPITALQMMFDPRVTDLNCSSCSAILGSEQIARFAKVFLAASAVIFGAIILIALYFVKLFDLGLFFYGFVSLFILHALTSYLFILWVVNYTEFEVLKKSTQKATERKLIFHTAKPVKSFQMVTLVGLIVAGSWEAFILSYIQVDYNPFLYALLLIGSPVASFAIYGWILEYDRDWVLYLSLAYVFFPALLMGREVFYFGWRGDTLLWLPAVVGFVGITLSAFSFIKWRGARKYLLSATES